MTKLAAFLAGYRHGFLNKIAAPAVYSGNELGRFGVQAHKFIAEPDTKSMLLHGQYSRKMLAMGKKPMVYKDFVEALSAGAKKLPTMVM